MHDEIKTQASVVINELHNAKQNNWLHVNIGMFKQGWSENQLDVSDYSSSYKDVSGCGRQLTESPRRSNGGGMLFVACFITVFENSVQCGEITQKFNLVHG